MSRNSPQRGKTATELREAYGVRPACWRCRKAGASSTHSKRFAWQFIQNHPRGLLARLTNAAQSIFVHPAPVKRLIR